MRHFISCNFAEKRKRNNYIIYCNTSKKSVLCKFCVVTTPTLITTKSGNTSNHLTHSLQLICINLMSLICCLAMPVTFGVNENPIRTDKRIKPISDVCVASFRKSQSLNSYPYLILTVPIPSCYRCVTCYTCF